MTKVCLSRESGYPIVPSAPRMVHKLQLHKLQCLLRETRPRETESAHDRQSFSNAVSDLPRYTLWKVVLDFRHVSSDGACIFLTPMILRCQGPQSPNPLHSRAVEKMFYRKDIGLPS